MYNVVIADDDHIILRGLEKNIPWRELGFQLIEAVDDSRRIEPIMQEQDIDLLLLDIDMPFVTGLEAAKRALTNKPNVVVLLLSAHDKFEYAQDAIQHGIFDYLLKPITFESLQAALTRARWKLDHEQAIASQIERSRPVLLEQFWNKVLQGDLSPQQAAQQAELLQISFETDVFIIVNIAITALERSPFPLQSTTLMYNVQELVKASFPEPTYKIITGSMDQIILLCCCRESDSRIFDQINRMAVELCESVKLYTKGVITVGVGDIGCGFSGIHTSFLQSNEALRSRILYGNDRAYFIRDVGAEDSLEVDWSTIMPTGSKHTTLEGRLQAIRTYLLDNGVTDENLMRFCILKILTESIEDIQLDRYPNLLQSLFDCYLAVQKTDLLDDMISTASQGYYALLNAMSEQAATDNPRMIDLAVDFIQKNYMRSGLKQSDVARSIYVSPTYLSTVFKHYLGKSFNEYLMELRIHKAIHLLRAGNLKMYEIAERVGFISPQYFSVCFKKVTGRTPSELYLSSPDSTE